MTKKYLIGIDKDGNFVYIEGSKWDCNWYWSGGYVEQGSLDTHTEAKRRAEEDDETKYYWQQAVEHGGYTESLEDFTELWVDEYYERLDIIEDIDDERFTWVVADPHYNEDASKKYYKRPLLKSFHGRELNRN